MRMNTTGQFEVKCSLLNLLVTYELTSLVLTFVQPDSGHKRVMYIECDTSTLNSTICPSLSCRQQRRRQHGGNSGSRWLSWLLFGVVQSMKYYC